MPQSKHTKAHAEFESVVLRSLDLLSLSNTIRSTVIGGNTLDLSDLCRAALVLAIAAMDAYYTNVFAEKLVPYLTTHKVRKEMIAMLEAAGLNAATALQLILMQRPHRRIRKLIEQHHERFTTQEPSTINKLFECFGFRSICSTAASRAQRKRLVTDVRSIVRRRNRIAHDGDLNAFGHLTPIDVTQTRRWIRRVILLVSNCDALIAKKIP